MMHTPAPRRSPIVVLAAVLAALVTACAGPSPEQPPAAAPAGAAFPVTIAHVFGETVVPAEPQRVVTLGFNEVDFALALGVVPVGVRDNLGDYPEETRPWAQEALGGARPENLGGTTINIERVAALAPDLILATYSYIERADYEALSAIAPTVGPVTEDGAITWQEELRIAGEALGRQERATQVRQDTERAFADAVAANPGFAGRSLALAFWTDASSFVLPETDPRAQFFGELGFTGPAYSGEFSAEQLGVLDNDVLVVLGRDRASLAADPLFPSVPVAAEERTVYFGGFDTEFAGALGFGSPLSLPYALEIAVPRLAAAVDGDPATSTDWVVLRPSPAPTESCSDGVPIVGEPMNPEVDR